MLGIQKDVNMTKKIDVGSLSAFNPAHFLNGYEDIKTYIQVVKEEGDSAALSEALSVIETLPPIHTEEEFNHIVFLMNELVAVVADNEEHPLASLLERVSGVVSKYERVRQKI